MQAIAFLRTFEASPEISPFPVGSGSRDWKRLRARQAAPPLRSGFPKQGILTRFNNYKLLILLRSHPDMEANPDFSFVTALLSVFSTSLPIGRFGGREAVELVRTSYRKSGLDLNSTCCHPIPTPNSECT
ncbi:hypothetical protein ACCT25_10410, partial [Rhizobium ruizarguesonis]